MSYEKLNLINGEKFSAEHVSHIEDGIVQNALDNDAVKTQVNQIKGDLGKLEDELSKEVETIISLDVQNGFWNTLSTIKHFNSDNARRSAMVSVVEGETYRLTTTVRPSSISGVFFFDADDKGISTLLDGTGTDVTYTDYEFVVPSNAVTMAVQSANTTAPVLKRITKEFAALTNADDFAQYIETRKIYLHDAETVVQVQTGTNWTANNESYTHISGSTSPLRIEYSLERNKVYWLEFDVDYTNGEFATVQIGSGYPVQCYNGTNHITVALLAEGNSLYINPESAVDFTISNITLYKISDVETEREKLIDYDSIVIKGHNNNYGFWNTFIAPSSAENAVSTTRSIAIGKNALHALVGGHRNIGIGTFALASMEGGKENVSVGSDSMYQVKESDGSVAIGLGAGSYADKSIENVMIGRYAMQSVGNGDKTIQCNVAIGNSAGNKTYGNNNTFVGYNAGYRNTSGRSNVMVGGSTLGCSTGTGNNNTFVGAEIYTSDNLHDSIGLGKGAIPTKSNQMMLGNTDITEVVMCGNKKIIFNSDGTVTWESI